MKKAIDRDALLKNGLSVRASKHNFATLAEEYEGVRWSDFLRYHREHASDGDPYRDRWIRGAIFRNWFALFENGDAMLNRFVSIENKRRKARTSLNAYDPTPNKGNGKSKRGAESVASSIPAVAKQVAALAKRMDTMREEMETIIAQTIREDHAA